MFVPFAIKAMHVELVTELTSTVFIAVFWRVIEWRGKPSMMWSDHGTNFIGASRELKELHKFCKHQGMNQSLSKFYSEEGIHWHFVPEHPPHFGGLWEATVKSFKQHFRHIVHVGEVRLTFEELTTTLAQIEASLNSRPLVPLPDPEEGIEALTSGHCLVDRPLASLPDSPSSLRTLYYFYNDGIFVRH